MLLFTDREAEAAALLRAAREDLPGDRGDLRGLLHALELTTVYFGNADPALREELRAAGERPAGPLTLADRARMAAASLDRTHRAFPADACAADALAALEGGELIEVYQGGTVPIAPMMTLIWADREEGLAQLDALQAEAHRSGSLFGANGVGMWRSHALHARGDLAGAEEQARRTVENTRMWGFGDAGSLTFLNGILATILVARGDVEGARAVLGGPWAMPRARGRAVLADGAARGARGRGRGRGGGRRGGRDRARVPEVTNPAPAPWRSLVAPALARLGRREEALARAREELQLARAWGAPGALGRALRVLGTLELDDDAAAGLARLEEAVAVLDPSPARLELARALAALGAALRRERRPADAREPLRRALELAVACSATGLAEHVRTELYAAGARPRTDARSGAAALTASERRVADLAAGGETNRDIAQTLYVTPKTVEVHLSNAYRKLGIRSQARARGRARGMTLIEREAEVMALDGAVAEAVAGNGRLLVIGGPAGIGKSGLLADLRARAADRLLVLPARASELEREFGFGVVRQLFEARAADPRLRRGRALRRRRRARGAPRCFGGAGQRRDRRRDQAGWRPSPPSTASSGSPPTSRRSSRCCWRSTTCSGATGRPCASSPTWRAGSKACRSCWPRRSAAASRAATRRCWRRSPSTRRRRRWSPGR